MAAQALVALLSPSLLIKRRVTNRPVIYAVLPLNQLLARRENQGAYAYDYGDVSGYTDHADVQGHNFMPPGIHTGGFALSRGFAPGFKVAP